MSGGVANELARYDHFVRYHESLEEELPQFIKRKGKQQPQLQATVEIQEADSGNARWADG